MAGGTVPVVFASKGRNLVRLFRQQERRQDCLAEGAQCDDNIGERHSHTEHFSYLMVGYTFDRPKRWTEVQHHAVTVLKQ